MAQPYKEQVLRMRYYDEAKLVEYLDETLGAGIWRLKVSSHLPRKPPRARADRDGRGSNGSMGSPCEEAVVSSK